jgi:hypothetical protein
VVVAKKNDDRAALRLRTDFRISNGPVASLGEESRSDSGEKVELRRVSGEKIFLAIARDPRTIFAYWNIDWPAIFGEHAPVDRQVHVRVYKADGSDESSVAVEPLSGNCYLPVTQARTSYRVEIGYYRPENIWNSVATADDVLVPPASVAPELDLDLVTIPFHLGFRRLIDLSRAGHADALTHIISRLQARMLNEEERALLDSDELAILRAIGVSPDEIMAARRAFTDRAVIEKMRRRAEAIVAFGGTSLSRGFGESSWS